MNSPESRLTEGSAEIGVDGLPLLNLDSSISVAGHLPQLLGKDVGASILGNGFRLFRLRLYDAAALILGYGAQYSSLVGFDATVASTMKEGLFGGLC